MLRQPNDISRISALLIFTVNSNFLVIAGFVACMVIFVFPLFLLGTYDGRAYLNTIDEKYDVIMVDAYQDISIPFQMSSVEFFTLVKNHLTENCLLQTTITC